MRRNFIYVLIALLPFLLAGSCGQEDDSDDPNNQPENQVLSVPFVPQQTQVWCWAATIEMVSRYYGRNLAQCQILSVYLNGDCCSFPQFCLVTAPTMQTIQAGLFTLSGLRSSYVPSPLTLSALQAEIDAGRPIIISYRGSFSGHVVVIYGYDDLDRLYIHDPFYGSFSQIPYGAAFSYGGSLIWAESIVGIQ